MSRLTDRAREVIDVWNRHDLDEFMSLHAADLVYSSPFARKMAPSSGGRMVGLEAVRPLWKKALEAYPDIHSTILEIYEGIDSVAVHYRTTARSSPVVDVMHFDADGKVCRLEVFHL